MICRHCSSKKVIRKGKRKLISSANQIYLCRNCGKRFSIKRDRFSDDVVLYALNCYNSGKSLSETLNLVYKKKKVNVSAVSINRWAKKHSASFNRIRDKLLSKYSGVEVVTSRRFIHSGLIYGFLLHNWKTNEFCRFKGLKNYLFGLDSWINKYFSETKRCSQLKSIEAFDVKAKKNFICTAVGNVLAGCSNNRKRHSVVQEYLIYNDSSTIAAEVPVWMWDKKIGAVSGHIDIVQVRFGKIWVMDYKPNAGNIDRLKVGSQLYWYTRALSFRTKLSMEMFRCAWFDEHFCYEFDPNKVRLLRE